MEKTIENRLIFERGLVFLVFLILPLIRLPFFDNGAVVAKWKTVHLFSLFALASSLFVRRSIILPKLGRYPTILLSSIFGLWAWNTFYHGIPWVSSVTADRLIFVMSCLFFCQLFRDNLSALWGISKALVLSGGVFIIVILANAYPEWLDLFFNSSIPYRKKIFFPFSNENMAAQFLGISFFCALFLAGQSKRFFIRCGLSLLSALFVLCIYKTGCRSVFLGVMGGGFLYGVWYIPNHYRKKVLWGATALFCTATIVAVLFIRPETVRFRKETWGNALVLSKEHPMGVGRERFLFYNVLKQTPDQGSPSSEQTVSLTPHNAFLKYLVEEGWIFLGLCMLFLLFLLRDHRVLLWQKLCQSRHLQFIASLSFLLLVESALQFPFEMALTYLCISMVCGYMLSVLPVGRSLSFLSLFSVPLFLAFFALLGCLLAGDIIYGSFKDKHSSLFGCRLSPYHKRLCHRSLQYIARQNPSAAIPLLKKELEKVPYSFVTLYELGRAYYMTGQHEKSCRVNVFYDRLFHRKSVLHSFTQKHCLGYELNKCEEVF